LNEKYEIKKNIIEKVDECSQNWNIFIFNRDNVNDLYTEVFEAGPQARVIELMILYVNEVFGLSSQSAFNFEVINTTDKTD
jgi:hypothetical protein